MNGLLPLWKNKGMTSHDCVVKVRKILHTKKVGHTGTLDPEVEGVLPICIGEATKIVPFLTETSKTYIATITLGNSTDTEDQTGKVEHEKKVKKPLSEQEIRQVLKRFEGEVSQQVPLYSAVKVNGLKLYEYARENIPVERPYRTITIHHINFISTSYNDEAETQVIQIEVNCSKGTYVRTLCVDIGKEMGLPAHMSSLVRTASGKIFDSDTLTLEELKQKIQSKQDIFLLPLNHDLSHLDKVVVDTETRQKVLYGQKLPLPNNLPTTEYFQMMNNNELLAIYQLHSNGNEIKPTRVFNFK